ncbi:MAG: LacI family DNA-binding transcriptional regulator [Clostridia bacterium]|nr:LacI family DNA-binding transcriptional regulator [Clostridia bacterium]
MANMRDVATVAGVSVSTVSAALGSTKYVSPRLKARVMAAVRITGYGDAHGEVRCDVSRDVAVMLPGSYSSFFPPLLNGITDAASEFGYTVLLYDSDRVWTKEVAFIDEIARRGCQNVILDSICDLPHEAEYFAMIKKRLVEALGARVVVLEREIRDDAFFSVYVDNRQAARDATLHLIDMGHTRIAHIGGSRLFPHSSIREQGYCQALEERGIAPDEHLILRGDFSPISGYAAMSELLAKGIPATAVFSANDQMAVGAIKAITTQGLRVPEDIAVAGFDNLTISSLISPGLTTVQYPIYQMGYLAMSNLARSRAGEDITRLTKLNARLVVRRSTDKRQIDDWNLQKW